MEDLNQNFINEIPKRLCDSCDKCGEKLPTSPWDKMPEGCKLEGWLFIKREEIKQKIRKQKEQLLTLQINLKTANVQKANEINKRIIKIKKTIEEYSQYGSADW